MELRDILLKEMYAGGIYGSERATAQHLAETLMYQTDPDLLRDKLAAYAQVDDEIGPDRNPLATHYKMAYDALYGDISVAPLHINDALVTVSKWRLSKT